MTAPEPIVIGLTGRAGSGKDTAAAYLSATYGFTTAAFADALRTVATGLLLAGGIHDTTWLTDPSRKNVPIPGIGFSARHILQTLGTEWGRRLMDDCLWIRLLEQRLGLAAGAGRAIAPRIVITDVRFPNEAKWLQLQRAPLIRLHRDSAPQVRAHDSEAHIDDLPAAIDIHNHGHSLDGLHELLDGVMAELGIGRPDSAQLDIFQSTTA